MEFKDFQRLLHSSKQYKVQGDILTLTEYYTYDKISINLSAIDEDMFDKLFITEDEIEEQM